MKLFNRRIKWTKVGAVCFFVAGVGLGIAACFYPVILPAALLCFLASHQLFKYREKTFDETNNTEDPDSGQEADDDEGFDIDFTQAFNLSRKNAMDFIQSKLDANVDESSSDNDNQSEDGVVSNRSHNRRRRKRH